MLVYGMPRGSVQELKIAFSDPGILYDNLESWYEDYAAEYDRLQHEETIAQLDAGNFNQDLYQGSPHGKFQFLRYKHRKQVMIESMEFKLFDSRWDEDNGYEVAAAAADVFRHVLICLSTDGNSFDFGSDPVFSFTHENENDQPETNEYRNRGHSEEPETVLRRRRFEEI